MREFTRKGRQERTRNERIGEVLLREGKLSQEQLRAALEVEKKEPARRLGEFLVQRGFVSKEDVARAVAVAAGLPFVTPDEDSVEQEALALIGEKALRRHGALPLRIEGARLVLAVGDPTNVLALDDLKALAGRPLRLVVAEEEAISGVLDRVFREGDELPELREDGDGEAVKSVLGSETLSISRGDEGGPVVQLAHSVVRKALAEGASDIHVEPRAKEVVVRYRVDGVLRKVVSVPLRLRDSLSSRLKIMGNLDISM